MRVFGGDPGAKGAIAFVGGPRECGWLKMPESRRDLLDWLDEESTTDSFGFVEKVGPRPGQGLGSTFKFGRAAERVSMAFAAARIPFEEVTPRTWQKALGIKPCGKNESRAEFKRRLKAKAQELFPDAAVTLINCDALLIAEYGRRARARMAGGAG